MEIERVTWRQRDGDKTEREGDGARERETERERERERQSGTQRGSLASIRPSAVRRTRQGPRCGFEGWVPGSLGL